MCVYVESFPRGSSHHRYRFYEAKTNLRYNAGQRGVERSLPRNNVLAVGRRRPDVNKKPRVCALPCKLPPLFPSFLQGNFFVFPPGVSPSLSLSLSHSVLSSPPFLVRVLRGPPACGGRGFACACTTSRVLEEQQRAPAG